MMDILTSDYPSCYEWLCTQLGLCKGLNFTPKWSAEADFLSLLVAWMSEHRPQTVIECSSGLSTLVLAQCCRRNGGGRVFSLENGPQYAGRTRLALREYQLEPYAEVIDAPLQPTVIGGAGFNWYELSGLEAKQAELVVVDGPPGSLRQYARYPALPLLRPYLDPAAHIILDDAARPDEQWILKRWLAQSPGACFRYIATRRGCGILTLKP